MCLYVLWFCFLQNPNTAVCGSKHGLIIGKKGRMGGRLKLREGRQMNVELVVWLKLKTGRRTGVGPPEGKS